jgi:hypothetical protein
MRLPIITETIERFKRSTYCFLLETPRVDPALVLKDVYASSTDSQRELEMLRGEARV